MKAFGFNCLKAHYLSSRFGFGFKISTCTPYNMDAVDKAVTILFYLPKVGAEVQADPRF